MRVPHIGWYLVKKSTQDGQRARRDDPALLEYFDDAVTGLNLIYQAAVAGHLGAGEALRIESERLVRRGADWHDMKYLKK